MWKYNPQSISDFFAQFPKLDYSRALLAASSLFLALLYPGHNSLQSLTLHPGPVKNFSPIELSPVLYPKSDGVTPPRLSSRAVVVQDVTSKTMIYERNPDMNMLPASTTKIMTALVARDYWKDLDTLITVKNEDRAIGQTIDLLQNEQLTVLSMLKGLLIHSGNDAALAIADNYCDPVDQNSCGYSVFVSAMNKKAKELHLDHTVYKNPSGIEQYGHVTTARDLAILASIAMSDPVIREIVSTRFTIITDVTNVNTHPLQTTNELLGEVPGLIGLKTGWTTNAGECLVSYLDRDGKEIVIVVLGSLNRFEDTRQIVDWTYNHHSWVMPTI